jgi:hypothetical protein
MGMGDITRMAVAAVALNSNGLVWRPRWLITATEWSVAMGEDVMSPKTIATKGHSSNGWFGDITKQPL